MGQLFINGGYTISILLGWMKKMCFKTDRSSNTAWIEPPRTRDMSAPCPGSKNSLLVYTWCIMSEHMVNLLELWPESQGTQKKTTDWGFGVALPASICRHDTSKANQIHLFFPFQGGLLPIAAWQNQWNRMKDRNWSSAFRVEVAWAGRGSALGGFLSAFHVSTRVRLKIGYP
jgi:hypothetical protein